MKLQPLMIRLQIHLSSEYGYAQPGDRRDYSDIRAPGADPQMAWTPHLGSLPDVKLGSPPRIERQQERPQRRVGAACCQIFPCAC